MQNFDYNLWALCVVGLLADQPLRSAAALPLNTARRTRARGHQRIQEGWLGRTCGPTQRPAMPQSQASSRPGHLLWSTTGSLDPCTAGSCSTVQGLPPPKSLGEHNHEAHPAARGGRRTTAGRLCPKQVPGLCLATDVSPGAAFTAGMGKNSAWQWLFWPLLSFHKRQTPATITALGTSSFSPPSPPPFFF